MVKEASTCTILSTRRLTWCVGRCQRLRRPYKVPDQITARQKAYNYYIRYNSSSIVPKGEYERELINLANRMPFDDRGNDDIKMTDSCLGIFNKNDIGFSKMCSLFILSRLYQPF